MLVGNVTICTGSANVKAWPYGGGFEVSEAEVIGPTMAVMVVILV